MLKGFKCREVDRNKLWQGRNINDFVLATSKSMFFKKGHYSVKTVFLSMFIHLVYAMQINKGLHGMNKLRIVDLAMDQYL